MVGSRHKDAEGDLFPRGAAPGSTPRVRKRNGQVLFGPQLKRPKKKESKDETLVEDTVTRHGSGLSFSRLSVGMTVLALVTKADVNGMEFTIHGGIRAAADPDEMLVQKQARDMRRGLKSGRDGSDSDSSDTDVEDAEDLPLPLYEALTVGSVVRAVLVDIDSNYHGRKAARVSLKPELVNAGLNPKHILRKGFPSYGVIKSVEDHGYVVSFGANISHTGFLSFQKCHIPRKEQTLQPGTPIETVTLKEVPLPGKRSKSFSAVVKLSSIRKEVFNATLGSSEAITYRDLCAGMLVKAKIVQVGDGGLVLTAFGVFSIEVDVTHVPRSEDGEMDFELGKQVVTRLMYVDSALKRIGGTLLDSMVKDFVPRRIPPELKTGTIIKSLIVDRVKPGFGILMRHGLGETDDEDDMDVSEDQGLVNDSEVDKKSDILAGCSRRIPIFAHLSRISDSKGLKLESRYQKGMKVDCAARIISISRLDGVINVDMRRSVLSRKALTIDEIESGAIYDCRILSHTSLGSIAVAVDGDPYLNGIIPHLHVSDVPIPSTRLSKHPHLRIGALLKCRVLYVKVGRGKIYLTARKSLVSPAYPTLTSYEQAKEALLASRGDKTATGGSASSLVFSGTSRMVTSKGGLLVEFCNGVVGLVRSDSLSLDKVWQKTPSKIEEVYPIGETVHVRIVNADPVNRRLFLSMSLQTDSSPQERKLQVGERVHGSIFDIDEQTKSVLVSVTASASKEDHQVDSQKSNGVTCLLPFGHLSDIHGLSERLASEVRRRLSSDDKGLDPINVRNLLVLSVGMGSPTVSMKPSLRKATEAGNLPMSFDDLIKQFSGAKKSGRSTFLRGYVKALLPGG
ncbi:S1 RNA binding protein [Gracilaria domingensis]|nr:S1 RNA binding protein [Gracilaria domingensis]